MRSRTTILFILLTAAAMVMFLCDIVVGSVNIPFGDVFRALFSSTDATTRAIVVDIRLIKAAMALLAGVALSLSGLQMQTLFRNPLAGPYVLGVSSGASFGVALFLLGAPLLGISSPALSAVGTTGAAWIEVLSTAPVLLNFHIHLIFSMLFQYCHKNTHHLHDRHVLRYI